MTSRRSIAQWDARLSRALQFRAGHVGGRVDSAQPIRRNGGTLRRDIVGTAGSVAVDTPCLDYDPAQNFTRTAFGATSADFAPASPPYSWSNTLSVRVQVDTDYTGDIDIWVSNMGADPSTPVTVTGPLVAEEVEFFNPPLQDSWDASQWRVHWDVSGALIACCSKLVDNE